MGQDLWGPIQPPRWLSPLEESLLNKQEGRQAAASFNSAWQSSFSKEQGSKLSMKENQQQADLQAQADARKNQMKLDTEEKERKRIKGEYLLNQSIQDRERVHDWQNDFKAKLAPFMDTLNPANQPQSYSPYGSPGIPGSVSPWLDKPLERTTPSDTVFGSGASTFSPTPSASPYGSFLGGTITGESGPGDPTYEDYQRAKSDHPALWLDPVTAPTMHLMDESWNATERIRMEAQQNKDKHAQFEAGNEAKNLALDVGTQGVNRFGFRENAYHKLPSELQVQIDSLPGKGRYSNDDPLTKRLGFAPLTSASENIINNWLSDNGQLRIDGANAEQIRQAKMEARIKAAGPGAEETFGVTKTGQEFYTIKPATTGKTPEIVQLQNWRDAARKSGDSEREKELTEAIKVKNAGKSSQEQAFLRLQQARDEYKASGLLDSAKEVQDRINKLKGTHVDEEDLIKIEDYTDKNAIKELDKKVIDSANYRRLSEGGQPNTERNYQTAMATRAKIWDRIKSRHTSKPAASAAPQSPEPVAQPVSQPAQVQPGYQSGDKLTPDVWGGSSQQGIPEPDEELKMPRSSPASATSQLSATAPSAAPTNAAPPAATNAPARGTNAPAKLPTVKTQADINKAIDLANKALQKNPENRAAIMKRLEEMGIQITK